MSYIMAFKDAKTGTKYKPDFSTQDLSEVNRFLKALSGRNWFQRRSHIRELHKHGATGYVHKKPCDGDCYFLIIKLN